MIPEGWTERLLGDLASLSAAPAKKSDGSRFVIVDMGSVAKDGSLLSHKLTDDLEDMLQVGDLVMPKDDIGGGQIIGKAVHIDVPNCYVLGDHVYRLRLSEGHPPYVRYAINSHSVNSSLRSKVVGSAQLGLGRSSVLEQPILFPPLAEQRAIAEALSDADALVESLDALIAKKRDMKQATMSQLFSGRIRLGGRKSQWSTLSVGSLATITKGSQLGRAEMNPMAEIPVWNGGVEPSGFTSVANVRRPVVTVSEGGNSCGWVGHPTGEFWLGGHCYALEPRGSLWSVGFLYHLLKSFEARIMGLRVGSGLPNIQTKSLAEFLVDVPSDPTEAADLTQVLDDVDTEINALIAQREKAELVKQGMMQELLSGRVRLV
jgi:type I restriction enzyme S subunit